MPFQLNEKLKIAITTRALFQLEVENKIFEESGRETYEKYQVEHEKDILEPGAAFPLVKALLRINEAPELKDKVEVLVMSRNSANTSLRVFNSAKAHNLAISRGAFTCGDPLAPYLKALDIDLFLTANPEDAQAAIDVGVPAATLVLSNAEYPLDCDEIRIAFDGDAVLFSEESEIIYKTRGLPAFAENEAQKADEPMREGPFAKFLKAISYLQAEQLRVGHTGIKIRTALVTARNAPAHERAIKTLRHEGVSVDAAFFLGGIPKTPILQAFNAHIFFDGQTSYSEPASKVVPSGTVPYRSTSVLHQIDR